jgi:EmrB/QacA subfamily drug resistance transporter
MRVSRDPSDVTTQRSALLVATTSAFTTPFLGSAVNVALPKIGTELGMDAVHLSWVASVYLLATAVCLLPFGHLADMTGRRRVFLIGQGIFTLTSLLCALSHSATMLIVMRSFQGMGAAMIFSTSLAILTSVFPPNERGRVIGINAAAVYLGLSAGPFVGGILTQYLGWQSIFHTTGLVGLLSLYIACRGLKGEWLGAKCARFDTLGTTLYGFAITTLMIGLSWLPSLQGLGLCACGLVSFILFWIWERRVDGPVFDVTLMQNNHVFALSNLASLINYSATFAVTFMLSLYLQYVRGLDPRQAGLLLLVQSIVMAAVSPFAGRLSDRLEPRIVSSVGMGLTVAGLLWLSFIGAHSPYWLIVGALFVLGAGLGLFSSPNTNAIMSSVERHQLGIASAILGTMRLTGQMLSMGVAVLVLALFVGRVQVTPDMSGLFLGAMHTAFLIFAALCVVGVFASLARGNLRAEGGGAKQS